MIPLTPGRVRGTYITQVHGVRLRLARDIRGMWIATRPDRPADDLAAAEELQGLLGVLAAWTEDDVAEVAA